MFEVHILIDVDKDEWEWVATTPSNNFSDIAASVMMLHPNAKGLQIVPASEV